MSGENCETVTKKDKQNWTNWYKLLVCRKAKSFLESLQRNWDYVTNVYLCHNGMNDLFRLFQKTPNRGDRGTSARTNLCCHLIGCAVMQTLPVLRDISTLRTRENTWARSTSLWRPVLWQMDQRSHRSSRSLHRSLVLLRFDVKFAIAPWISTHQLLALKNPQSPRDSWSCRLAWHTDHLEMP